MTVVHCEDDEIWIGVKIKKDENQLGEMREAQILIEEAGKSGFVLFLF